MNTKPMPWKKANAKGVSYREHPTRKYGVKKDRYYRVRYQRDGKTLTESLGWASEGMSEQKAVVILAGLKEAVRTGEGETSLKEKRATAKARREAEEAKQELERREAVTFGEFFKEQYFPHAQASKKKSSWERDEQLFRLHLAPVIGKMRLTDMNEVALRKVISRMEKAGKSARTQEYCLAVARQVMNYAHASGVLAIPNPVRVKNVAKLKINNQRQRYLSPEEAGRLLAELKTRSQQVYEMALISFSTGARFGEIAALRWQHVNLEQGVLTLLDTKARDRQVFLPPELKAVFKKKERGSAGDLVFPNRAGNRLPHIPQVFRDVVEGLGFNDDIDDRRMRVCFHTLRHSHASLLVQNGVDLYAVQKQLGHQTHTMTQRYSHLSPNVLRRNADVFAQACMVGERCEQPEHAGNVVPLHRKAE